MKSTLLFTALLFSLLLLPGCQRHITSYKSSNEVGFSGDSGYVYNHDLLRKIKFDIEDSLYKRINSIKNDTVGKYYKATNGHYFSCLEVQDGFPGFILVETLSDGRIIAKEVFGVGIHDCCWNSQYEGFKKYEDYISFRTCTTGTSICGGSIDLFKNLKPQHKMRSIGESLWYATNLNDNYRDLTSTMQIESDTVIMHYTVIDYSETNDKKEINSTDKFSIRYVDNNSAWTPLDSAKYILDF